ncbi:MAG: DUF2231 domain-containing protein [Anaerolineae bacterium]
MLFGHPLHPATVHFPIALYCLGVLLTGLHLWRNQPELERFAFLSFGLAWLATLVACVAGLIDQNQLAVDDPRLAVVNNHITGAVTLLIVNGLLVYMRFRWPDALTSRRAPYLGLMALGLAAVLVTGWLGGELVYNLRVGVN